FFCIQQNTCCHGGGRVRYGKRSTPFPAQRKPSIFILSATRIRYRPSSGHLWVRLNGIRSTKPWLQPGSETFWLGTVLFAIGSLQSKNSATLLYGESQGAYSLTFLGITNDREWIPAHLPEKNLSGVYEMSCRLRRTLRLVAPGCAPAR